MNIGIIVYSQTGNTKSVAEQLKDKLNAKGHSAVIEEVVPAGEVSPGMKEVTFTSKPDVEAYDAVIFGAPVQAFSLAAAMKAYMRQIGSLQGKKAACFVTKQLRGKWTGGNGAVKQLCKFCEASGGMVAGTGIIIWSSKEKEQMIENTVEELSSLFINSN